VTEGIDHPNPIILQAQIAKALFLPAAEPSSQQDREDAARAAIDAANLVMPFIEKLVGVNKNLHALLKARDFQIDRERQKNRQATT
jgi:hypothetical protein